jgi:phage-related protein
MAAFADANKSISGFAPALQALGGTMMAVSQVNWGSLIPSMGALNASMLPISGTVLLIAGAFAAAVAVGLVIAKVFGDDIRAAVQAAGEALGDFWDWLKTLPDKIGNAIGFIIDVWKGYIDFIKSVPGLLLNALKKIPGLVWKAFKGIGSILNKAKNLYIDYLKWVGTLPGKIFKVIKSIPGKVWQALKGLGGVLNKAKNAYISYLKWVGKLPGKIFNAIKSIPGKVLGVFDIDLVQVGKDWIDSLIKGVKDMIPDLEGTFKDAMDKVRSFLPGSDAERGPLSDLTDSAQAIPETMEEETRKGVSDMEIEGEGLSVESETQNETETTEPDTTSTVESVKEPEVSVQADSAIIDDGALEKLIKKVIDRWLKKRQKRRGYEQR